ncbi:MAG TPA: RidA family protein [Solirubrobacterales bacterium]|nr:RidA family protein [Solirubrobacterales bacterium]
MPPEDRQPSGGALRVDIPGLSFAGMSQAVRGGDLVLVSGQVALDSDGNLVGEGDAAAQAAQALANVEAALAAAGATREDLVKLSCFLVDAADYPAYAAAKSARFGSVAPASTCVVVSALLDPRFLLEVEAVALVG